ncbi:cellulase family glycosylhydrolase [Croceitalea marina]|uniref:Cellulase family glycosylhydrolase n=1 Tax=Croceitalea marina TaxID=1775166 RepID=A0ABW5MWP0_9FLAO
MNRNLYRTFLIISFLALIALLIIGISSIWSYLKTGAERGDMLHLPKEISAEYLPKVIWGPLKNEGRPMEKQTLNEIERDYLKAWLAKNSALANNNPLLLADYYTDSIKVKFSQLLDLNKKKDIYIKTTTLSHNPHLEFYSADGKIAIITDKNVSRYEETFSNNNLIYRQKSTATYKVILLLEDGFWRIRHISQVPSSNTDKSSNILKTDELLGIIGINYYPAEHAWNMFGNTFDEKTLQTDFNLIQNMGLNTIRIFVPYDTFGKAEVSTEKLQQLRHTLDIALEHQLKVTVTLFDFYGDYSIANWTLTHRHAEQIVSTLKGHEALQAWDIKNEPDLDFESRGKQKVISWLSQMISEIKTWDSETPITIGWSSPESAKNLSSQVDFVSFHYYQNPLDFLDSYTQLKKAVAEKTIVLQEYGFSSYDGLWNAFLGSEENQAAYYKEMQAILNTHEIPYLFWTLHDFETVPNSVAGRLPWRKTKQKHFGILDAQGKEKKAYSKIVSK